MERHALFAKYQASESELATARTARAVIAIYKDYRLGVRQVRQAAHFRHEAAVAEHRAHGRTDRYQSIRAVASLMLHTADAYSEVMLEQRARMQELLPEAGKLAPLLEQEAAAAHMLPPPSENNQHIG